MEKYVENITNTYTHEFGRSAVQYLKAGLDLFHKQRQSHYEQPQIALGNLAIAIELMLKTLIVKNHLGLLFKDIPLDLKVVLSCPQNIPESFNWRPYDIDLRSFAFKTIDLNECISCFYIFFPDLRQTFQPHFKFLSRVRNTSLHSAFPSFQQYELDRVAFLALQIFKILSDKKVLKLFSYLTSDKDGKFLDDFQAERIERVKKAIENAKKKSREISHKGRSGPISELVDDWDFLIFACPICESWGLLMGYTEDDWVEDEDGPFPALEFYAEAFSCDECGLSLEDVEELKLAGIDTHYDRSDDIDKWFAERGNPYEDY